MIEMLYYILFLFHRVHKFGLVYFILKINYFKIRLSTIFSVLMIFLKSGTKLLFYEYFPFRLKNGKYF